MARLGMRMLSLMRMKVRSFGVTFGVIIIIIIINHLYSAKIQKFSGASHSMRNIIKNILIKNIYKINENKKIDKLNKFKTNKSLGSF